jgi:hypothetical protein
MKHNAIKQSTMLRTFLNSNHYRQSGMLIQWQNSYLTQSQRCAGNPEAQSHEPVKNCKNLPVQIQKDKSTQR